jgi:tryptophanyl-tRNA synthetase
MFTETRQVADPGKVEGNTVFTYLDAFATDKAKLGELKSHYQRGGLGDSVVKKYLLEVLQEFLEPVRTRRAEYAKDPEQIWQMIFKGTAVANEVTQKTLSEVKAAMGIDYRNR